MCGALILRINGRKAKAENPATHHEAPENTTIKRKAFSDSDFNHSFVCSEVKGKRQALPCQIIALIQEHLIFPCVTQCGSVGGIPLTLDKLS